MERVKNSDVLIIGAGVIGLSLACSLRRAGLTVRVLERHQPGHEATWASGGMIARHEVLPNAKLRELADASADLYPAFVRTLEDESDVSVDFRSDGKILFVEESEEAWAGRGRQLSDQHLAQMEPELSYRAPAVLLDECWLDPRKLVDALVGSARHLGVDIVSGAEVNGIELEEGKVLGAFTSKAKYHAASTVNCAGAWSGQFSPIPVPVRPVKGQMLAVIHERRLIHHVIHGLGVYMIPRSDGRIVIGATVEEAGYDKRVEPDTIQELHQRASLLVPNAGEARIHESWAGLRPGTPDDLPILGSTSLEGYFVAAGHFRDGILLAPITARIMTATLQGQKADVDVTEFSLERFNVLQ